LDVENREKRSVGTGVSATGTQADPSNSGDGAFTDGTCERLLTVEELEASIGDWQLSPEEKRQIEGEQGKKDGYNSGRSNPYTRSRTSEAAATSMAERDGTGTVVSRRTSEEVDKDAEVIPMSVQGEPTGVQEESKEAPSELTVAPTTITAPLPPTMTTTTARRARFLEYDGDERIDPRERANERKPVRKYAIRYDLKLALPPTEPADALEALVMVLQKVWKQLKEADKRLVVYPWGNKEAKKLSVLKKVEDLPERVPAIQEYFNRAFPRKAGGVMYVSVYLGHDRSFKEMHSEVDWWLVQEGFGWYKKALQCEKSVVIGWLLYSTIDMDRELLASEIFKATNVQVGLRFRTISVNSKESLSKDQMVGAIHVEIDEENYFGAKARVEDLYKADRESGFPLDIKLRLCPQIQDASDPTTITKFERLRIRQAAFLENVQKTQTGDIAVLDFADEKLGMQTLRQLIMNIRDADGVRVFISVDRHFLGRGFVFQYTSKFANVAPARIRGLLPFLKAKFDKSLHGQLDKCFSRDAVHRALSYRWDEVKGCVVSAADKAVEDLIEWWDLDDEYEFPGTDTTKFELDISAVTKVDDTATAYELFGAGRRGGVNPYDADSVSTMVSRHAKGKTTKQKASGKSTEKEKATATAAANKEEMNEKVKAITVKLRNLEKQLERALMGSTPSRQPGQAEDQEVIEVGDGDASDGSSA